MRLRTRLALALFMMSVLPVAAITLYSYHASLEAFRRAAAAEAGLLAGQMAQRMEYVTNDLQQRVDRMWRSPGEAPESGEPAALEGRPDEMKARLAAVLGSFAGVVERVEFLPAGETAPAPAIEPSEPEEPPAPAPPPSAKPPEPSAEAPPARPQPAKPDPSRTRRPPPAPRPQRIVVDLTELEKLKDQLPFLANLDAEELAGVSSIMARQIEVALRIAERELAKPAAPAPGEPGAEAGRPHRWVVPERRTVREVGFSVGRGDHVVGTVRTHLDLDRTLAAIMSVSRRDQGEIPFAMDPDRRLYTPRSGDRKRLQAANINELASGGGAPVGSGDWIVATREDPSGVVFGIARPVGPALQEIRRTAASNLAIGISVMALAFFGVVPLSRRMTRNLSGLAEGVRRIAQGNLAARVPVKSRDEIGELAAAVNQMASDLEAHQKLLVKQERLHRELELCRQIQTDMLPHDPLRTALAEVRGVSIPAREVGGDFFNYFVLPRGDLALLVGDVAGKGVGAALLMANIQATLRARLPLENDLPALVSAIDEDIERNTPRGVYITLFVGILDTAARTLRYVNAGHNPQFVVRRDGTILRLPSTGLPVGMFAGHGYEERSITLSDGDHLFFYTDGAVEVENERGDMFGSERLEAHLLAGLKGGDGDLLGAAEQAIRDFRGSAEPFDDATIMVLRLGTSPAAASV